MKRWIVWPFVSVTTFFVGTLFVYAYLTLTAPIFTAERVIVQAAEKSLVAQAPLSLPEPVLPEDDFNAEIVDINYAELELDREPDFDFHNIIESGTLRVSSYFTDLKRGERKFVMFEQNGRYYLRRSSAVFASEKVKGAEYSLVTISFNGPGKSVFIFSDLLFLKDGEINTLYLRPAQSEIEGRGLPIAYSLWKRETRSFALGKNYYTVRVTKGLASDGRKLDVLLLEKDYKHQVIDAIEYHGEADESFTDVVWAGDLDHDGKLDLITNGTQGIMLHVSSKAEPGKLVKLASFGGPEGC